MKTTVAFAFLTVPAGHRRSDSLLAVLAHQKLRGMHVYRTIFSSTVATSVAVASVIFGTLFNPVVGLLPWLGVNPSPPILDNPDWALAAVALVTIWQTLGLTFILMSSGLQAIPDELHEAARVDGAGPCVRFWRVTLPLLSPTIFFAVVVGGIFAFQTFGQIDILTQGGPLKRTNVLTYSIFTTLRHAEQRRQGRGARGRAVRDHARADAGADAGPRTAGALCPLTRAPSRTRPCTWPDRRAPRRVGGKVVRYFLLSLLAFIVIFPLYITVVNSLLRPDQIAAKPPKFFPFHPDWSSYSTAWTDGNMGHYLLNSAIVTIIITVGPGRRPRSSPGTRSRSSSSR